MDWLSIVGSVASVATAIGVFVAGWQIRLAKQLARTQFEDTLTQQFRDIIWKIPVDALIGLEISEEQYQQTRDDFFRYIDLSNEQVFLRKNNRISKATWELWRDGMKAFLARPSFNRAWKEFKAASPDIFRELRRLEGENFETDPCTWVQ